METFNDWLGLLDNHPLTRSALALAGLLFAAWLADLLTRRILLRIVHRLVQASPMKWDDALIARGVVRKLSRLVPALVLYLGLPLIALPPAVITVGRNVALAWMILAVALSFSAMLSTFEDIYRTTPRGRQRPIKGYLQVAKLVTFIIAGILVVAALMDRSPLLLLSGVGALGAVLMLVFKDTILSLVASVQVNSNDMLRVGDWIEMPQLGADGDVIDVALHTVKVQNWDKTITTIPTHRLISESFKNWRGMSESGGRRIRRALHIDQNSIRFLDAEERQALHRFSLLGDYLEHKRRELEEWNRKLEESGLEPVNHRRLTNIGTFRAYVEGYLRHHPMVHSGMTLLVRQQQSGPDGLPMEIYCFTNTTVWAQYEAAQGDIFDHLIAVLPEFGLRLFQRPSGTDVQQLLQRLPSSAPESVGTPEGAI